MYTPLPRSNQQALLDSVSDMILFAGYRATGRSVGAMLYAQQLCENKPESIVYVFTIQQKPKILQYTKQQLGDDWRFVGYRRAFGHKNGSFIKFRPVHRGQRAVLETYMCHSMDLMVFDDADQLENPVDVLLFRHANGRARGKSPQMLVTSVPNILEWYFTARYIDPNCERSKQVMASMTNKNWYELSKQGEQHA